MKKLIYFFFLPAIVLVASCNNNSKADNDPVDSSDTEIVDEEAMTAPMIGNDFPELFTFIKEQDSTFSEDKFDEVFIKQPDTLAPSIISRKQMELFYPYLIFNRSGTKAIDLVSYNYIPSKKQGKTLLQHAGPDTEVALIDYAAKSRQRILYLGASASIFDARWESDTSFVLAGYEEVDSKSLKPVLLRYNVNRSEFEIFRYSDTLNATAGDYAARHINARTPN